MSESRIIHPNAKRPFRAPAGPLMSILGLAGCLYLISRLPVPTLIRFVVWFAVGVTIYAFYGYRHSQLRKESTAPTTAQGE